MITKILNIKDKAKYDSLINHPVQTWDWGDFQISQGHKVYRLGVFDNQKMISAYSVSFHTIPKTLFSVGTVLKGPKIDQEMVNNLKKIATDENAIFVKLEPDFIQKKYTSEGSETVASMDTRFPSLVISPKVAFYPYSYMVDLTKTEDALLYQMHSKTRYNIKIANRHGVKIEENSTDAGFETYLELLFDTTARQGFYLHSQQYHRDLWKLLKPTGIPHIFLASYQGEILSAFMLFIYKDQLFYPYGASLDQYREVMAPTLLMWESIKFGKSMGLKNFDMWGSLGPDAKEGDQGFGFHRFKQGFGGQLVQYAGTYDLVINQPLYSIYNLADKYRWKFLRLKSKFIR